MMSNVASGACPSRSASVAMVASAYLSHSRRHPIQVASEPVKSRSARLAVAAMTLAAGLGAGCQGDGDKPRSTATTGTVARTTPGVCAGFRGATTVLQSVGPTAPGLLTSADAGAIGCLDQVTFTFRSIGDGTPPRYTVEHED